MERKTERRECPIDKIRVKDGKSCACLARGLGGAVQRRN